MDVATEPARKYKAPGTFMLPDLVGIAGVRRVGEPQVRDLDATYFDTEDLRLARHRMTLLRRTGGPDAGWHLTTPGSGDDRTKHRMPLGEEGDVPAELLARVRAVVRDRPLVPVARLRTRRQEYPLNDNGGRVLALLADDRVDAEVNGAGRQWREMEIGLVEGDRKVLKALDKRVRAAGAKPAGRRSKLAHALGERLYATRAEVPSSGGPKEVQAVFAYVRDQRDAIVGNDPAVRKGDPAAVHAMRVATRRLRSTLRTFRNGIWDLRSTQALRGELSWLADQLGGVRDRQVMATRLHRAVAAEPAEAVVGPVDARITEHLDNDLKQGRLALGDALDDVRYIRLLDDLDALVDAPPAAGVRGGWVRHRAAKALHQADALLDEAMTPPERPAAGSQPATGSDEASCWEHDRDERLHEARRAYKRARYAVEVFVPREGAPARLLVKSLTALQDLLGDHQDATITRAVLREYGGRAHAAGDSAFSYGVLYARQDAAAEAALVRLPDALRASRRRLRRWPR